MLAVQCPSVPTRTGLTLVPESRIVRLTDDGAGTITVVVACYDGHLHEVVTGRAVTEAAATPLRRRDAASARVPAQVPAQVRSQTAGPAAAAC